MKSLYLLLACSLVSACASRKDSASSPAGSAVASPYALPASWYVLPEQGGTPPAEANPSPAADAAVSALFRSHTTALEATEAPAAFASLSVPAAHPADWVPWHLEGMMAAFAVDVSGLFGALLFDGTATIRANWQRAGASGAAPATAAKATAVRFSSSMTAQDLAARLEPVVQAALASGSVKNEAALRAALISRGRDFLAVCAVLDAIPSPAGWHVDGFQLQLTVTGLGQVTPLVGVGGGLNIFFDWAKAQAPGQLLVATTPAGAKLAASTPPFVAAFQSALAALPADAQKLSASGFVLDQVQLGVAVGVNGDIGLAQLGAAVNGKIVFHKNSAGAIVDALAEAPAPKPIPLLRQNADSSLLAFAAANGVASSALGDGSVAFLVAAPKFQNGLTQALKMASYFATRARRADTKTWKVTQIEAEFDASVTGDLKVATVGGQGQVVLDFHPAGT